MSRFYYSFSHEMHSIARDQADKDMREAQLAKDRAQEKRETKAAYKVSSESRKKKKKIAPAAELRIIIVCERCRYARHRQQIRYVPSEQEHRRH